jgi:hypothetical protein
MWIFTQKFQPIPNISGQHKNYGVQVFKWQSYIYENFLLKKKVRYCLRRKNSKAHSTSSQLTSFHSFMIIHFTFTKMLELVWSYCQRKCPPNDTKQSQICCASLMQLLVSLAYLITIHLKVSICLHESRYLSPKFHIIFLDYVLQFVKLLFNRYNDHQHHKGGKNIHV